MPLEHASVTAHARAWIRCRRTCTHARSQTNTHKKKTRVAVPPTCFVKEQTSPPVTITGPDLCHKRQEGPDPPAPRGLVRNPQVSERREGEGGEVRADATTNAYPPAPSRGPTNAAARPADSQSSARPQSPSSPGRNRAAPSPGVGTPGPLCGEEAEFKRFGERILHSDES